MSNDPPRIRDDRRDPDLTRLKERLAIVEERTDSVERLSQGMHYALFGIPEDRSNNGVVGTLSDMKQSFTDIQHGNNRILGTIVAGIIIDVVARALLHG